MNLRIMITFISQFALSELLIAWLLFNLNFFLGCKCYNTKIGLVLDIFFSLNKLKKFLYQ